MLGAVRGGLGAGQAAHLAVLRARLVHEGAVLAGPHGRRDGVGRPPHGTVLLQAGELHANRACGKKKKRKKKTVRNKKGAGGCSQVGAGLNHPTPSAKNPTKTPALLPQPRSEQKCCPQPPPTSPWPEG